MTAKRFITPAVLAAGVFCLAQSAQAQMNFDNVEVKTTQLADGFYMLEGAGGNLGLSVGEDGAFLIDDQFAPLTPKIKAAIADITDDEVTFVINTHYHGDHTGGNEQWGEMGSIIVAQENVRSRLAAAMEQPEAPYGAEALPVITFSDEATFHWNGNTISVHHMPNAHTDGDAFIYFREANVIHMGDVFRTVSYPRVDGGGGGSMRGILAGLEQALFITEADTKFLPGHGVVSSREEVAEVLEMMKTIWNRVAAAKSDGKSLDEVKAMTPTAEFDEKWNTERIPGDLIVEQIYNEL